LFEVSAPAIGNLTSEQFVAFVAHLVRAELVLYGGAPDDFLGSFAPGADGGRDATTRRIVQQRDGSDVFIPEGETVWQCKAELRAPSVTELAEEMSKPKPLSCLERGGNYTFLAQKPDRDEDETEGMLKSIALMNGFDETRVRFFAQHRLAEFARRHPSLALLPFFPLRPEGLEPFETWQRDHESIAFEPAAHANKLHELRAGIRSGRFHVAVTGPTGVGKSRLVLEAIRELQLTSLIAYASSPGPQVDQLVTHLRTHGASCIVIVDECDEANAAVLRERLSSTQAGLITIGADREGNASRAPSGDSLVRLQPMDPGVISKVLSANKALDQDTRNWIAAHTGGYIRLAKIVGDELARDQSAVSDLSKLSAVTAVEHALVRMVGRDQRNRPTNDPPARI
jgi:hypothetical protein